MPVIGTAGHVDHGKSTLILALTGRDPDRFEEEKRRGLTIDLGFAWATLPGGTEVSFVDVPGHERFIKNMLAGVESIDAALFVVAADEGWREQSEEHLAVLDLLDVTHGVIALTKVDRVDADTVELMRWEITDKLRGTSLEAAPIVSVSAPSGHGLAELATKLEEAARASSSPGTGRPRLWVDRAFTISGAGTVVTGTLLGGVLAVGTTVSIWPSDPEGRVETARIRGLESHEVKMETAPPSRRVAVNLAGLGPAEVHRGAMLGLPGEWQRSRRFLATFRLPRQVATLPSRGSFQLHLGSGAWPVRFRQVDQALALCELEAGLCLAVGDRFILRDTGLRAVVAGGRLLDPAPPRKRAAMREVGQAMRPVVSASPAEIAQTLLAVRGRDKAAALLAHSGGGIPTEYVAAGELLIHPDEAARLTMAVVAAVEKFHETMPLRPGIAAAHLAATLDTSAEVIEALAESDHRLRIDQGLIALTSHTPDQGPSQAPEWIVARARLEEAGLMAPPIADLGLDRELLAALFRAGELVKIGPDLAYRPREIGRLVEVLERMPAGFSVSEFRQEAGITRKYAVPFLEWADGQEITVRVGDGRTYRGPRSGLP